MRRPHFILFLIALLFCSLSFAQTAQPRYPINGDRVSPNPKFTAIASSLVPGVTYNIVVSEQPRGGGAGVDQYLDFWVKEGVTADGLLDTNLNRVGWDSTWVRKTRNGSYTAAAVNVPNYTTPSSLPYSKTYYWHIYGNNGTKSVENTFSTLDYRRMVSGSSPVNGAIVDGSSANPCFTWNAYTPTNFGYYTVMVSTTPDFPTARWAYQVNTATTTSACWNNGLNWLSKGTSQASIPAPGPLQNGVTYYWRVLITYSDGAILNRDFVGSTFTYRASSVPSTSSRSSSSAAITSSSRSSSSVAVTNSSSSVPGLFNFNTQAPAAFNYPLTSSGLPTLGNNQLVATTQGKLAVNNGVANYSVDIELPPAARDLKPKLALNYNSRSGNGLMGVGWGLSGLSAITRCRATFTTEGAEAQKSNPRYTVSDRLCLDGQKLVVANSAAPVGHSTYWAAGTEYRTELDNFSRIVAYGSSANGGHGYFKVWTKDGRVLTFGEADSSQGSKVYSSTTTASAVSSWLLDKVEDAYGNNYTISYTNDLASGDYYPQRVNFAPGAAAVFNYQDRLGQIPWGYSKGNYFKRKKVLDSVTTYINVTNPLLPENGTPVKRYDADYVISQATQRELVDSITECGYESSSWKCAKPLKFSWGRGEFGFDVDNPFTLQYCSGTTITDARQVVDLDGDERNDIITTNGKVAWGATSLCFDNGDWVTAGYTIEAAVPLMTKNGYALLVQTIDKTVTPNKKVVGLITNINRSTNTKTYIEIDRDSTDVGSFMVDDLNNDGLDDFNYKGIKFIQSYQSTPAFVQTGSRTLIKSAGTVLLDIYSDGLRSQITTDVNYSTTNGMPVGVFVVYPSGASFEANTTKLYTVAEPFKDSPIKQTGGLYRVVADINGDGNKDFLYHQVTGDTGKWFYRINAQNGSFGNQIDTGIVAGQAGQSYYVNNHFSYAYDYDQDGRDDLLAIVPSGPNVCKLRVLLARDTNGGSANFVEAKDSSGNQVAFLSNLNVCNPVYGETQANILMGDVNNDGSVDISYSGTIYPGKQKQPDLLTGVTDGFSAQAEIRYSPLIPTVSYDTPLYSPGTKPQFPHVPASRGVPVVSMVGTSNGLGNLNYRNYYYTGARADRQGRGFIGFQTIKIIDNARSIASTTDYRLDWPFTGKVKKQTIKDMAGKLIGITDNSYEMHSGNARFPFLYSSLQRKYELTTTNDSFPVSASKIVNTFDSCGNLRLRTTQTGTGVSGTDVVGEQARLRAEHDYDDFGTPSNCGDDFMYKSTEDATKPDGSGLKRAITEFTPNAQRDIYSRTDFKGEAIQKTETYDHEANGVVNKITSIAKDIDGTDEPARITTFSNFSYGIFPQTVTNAENHQTTFTYDYRFGSTKTETFLGQTTTNSFDALGYLVSQKTPDSTLTESISFYCTSAPVTCPTGAVYGIAARVTHASQSGNLGEPLSIVFYDSLQREIRRVVYSLDGKTVNKVTQYSPSGNLYRVSEPYSTSGILASHAANAWTVYSSYDALGRANSISGADGGGKTLSYTTDGYGLKVTENILVVKPSGSSETQTSYRWHNVLGQVTRVEDPQYNTVSYSYDAAGNLETTQVNNNVTTQISLSHDVAGNKIHISDPDAGVVNFNFNGFGELRKQTWQKGVAGVEKYITYDYDKLGRQTSRVDNPASGSAISYSWVWDTRQQGQLSYRAGNGFQEDYYYDGFSRLSRQIITTSGLSGGEFVYTYDNFSRPQTVKYPNGFKIQRDYHAAGYQVQTRDVTSTARVLWALGNGIDTRGAFNQQLWGNGVVTQTGLDSKSGRLTGIKSGRLSATNNASSLFGDIQNLSYGYDSLGNLITRGTARTNTSGAELENITETFSYDSLNRLKTINTSGLFTRTQTFEYDSGGLGNLTKRTDLLGGSSVNNDVGQINYDRVRNAGIHAVTSAGGINYSYDRYGNMTTRGSETIVYNTFNKPTRITGVSITDFYYDPDHELYKEIRGSKTIYKVAGGRYEVIVEGSTTTQKSYVDGVILNTRTLVNGVQNTDGIAYLHGDHIGSVEATSNALGQFVNRMSFGAWGERQLSNWKPGTPTETFLTGNGFTGHDQLDNHNLIHMGGRVYDPNLGRFLSADLIVQSPYNSQSYNRYSYTFNNPTSYIDPTGYGCTTHYFHNYYRNESGSSNYLGMSTQQTCDGNDFYNRPDYNNGYENFEVPEFTLNDYSLNYGPPLGVDGAVASQYAGCGMNSDCLMDTAATEAAAMSLVVGGEGAILAKLAWETRTAKVLADSLKTASGGTKTLRAVGQMLENVEDVLANPSLLKGLNPAQLMARINKSDNWIVGTMNKTRSEDKGFTLRELNKKGTDFTDRYIQYHPGSQRHFDGQPYWKVSSGSSGTVRVPVN